MRTHADGGPSVIIEDEVKIKEEAITVDNYMISDDHYDAIDTPSSCLASTHQSVNDEADILHDGGPAVIIKDEVTIREEAITVDNYMITVDHHDALGTPSSSLASTHQPEDKDEADILHGEKPYCCDVCDYRTGDPSNLKTHEVSHRDRLYRTDEQIAQLVEELGRGEAEEEAAQEEFIDAGIDDDPDYEPEHTEDSDHNSDSDIDLEDGECDDWDQEDGDLRFYLGKDGESIWASNAVALPSKTKSKNIIKTLPGPRGEARHCKTKLECFLRIITPEMIENIVRYTNIFIERKLIERQTLAGESRKCEVRERDYKPTTSAEISALFGALFLIGVKRGNSANFDEFWNSNGTGLMVLRANFSVVRAKFLLRALRFDDLNTRAERQVTDRLAPIREVTTSFITNSQNSFNLGENVTIDEMLVAFRGRCSFIRYMASKPAKYGLKIYAMCDARICYTYNLEVSTGKQQLLSNKPYDLVLRLVQCIENTNRNLTTDNYFSSYELAEYLLSRGLTFLGTMRSNRKHLPPEFVTVQKNATAGDYLFGCQPDKTLVSMITKKNKAVVVLSTMHDADEIDETTKKPCQIMDYNFSKGGVDTVDFMCSRISTSRRTQRWPVTIFFRLLDLAGINSLRIFQCNTAENISRGAYLHELALDLMNQNLKYRAKLKCLPKDLLLFLEQYREEEAGPRQPPLATKRGICYLCGTKKNIKTRRECGCCGKNVCLKHSTVTVRCDNCRVSDNDDMETD